MCFWAGRENASPFLNSATMKNYISEGRAIYEDYNHGNFSKKLAEWAIGQMKVKDAADKSLKPLKPHDLDEMREALKANKIQLPDGLTYSAWYLWNMTYADYPKTITTDEQRATFVEETLLDPDCDPAAVLECFTAKMATMGIPIFWENYL